MNYAHGGIHSSALTFIISGLLFLCFLISFSFFVFFLFVSVFYLSSTDLFVTVCFPPFFLFFPFIIFCRSRLFSDFVFAFLIHSLRHICLSES